MFRKNVQCHSWQFCLDISTNFLLQTCYQYQKIKKVKAEFTTYFSYYFSEYYAMFLSLKYVISRWIWSIYRGFLDKGGLCRLHEMVHCPVHGQRQPSVELGGIQGLFSFPMLKEAKNINCICDSKANHCACQKGPLLLLQKNCLKMCALGKPSKKKASFFWTLSKSGLDPPPHFGHCKVTFVSAHFGQPWGNFFKAQNSQYLDKKSASKLLEHGQPPPSPHLMSKSWSK